VRANAVFALPPLLIYMIYPALLSRPIRFLAACLIIVVVAIPAASAFNHKVLHAEDAHPLHSLEIFDIAGIAHFSGDMAVFGDGQLTEQLLSECYTYVLWDRLGDGNCRAFLESLGSQPTEKWLSAITRHPTAYAEHRAAHFNSELGAFLPIHHAQDKLYNWMVYIPAKPTTMKEKIIDYIRFSAVFPRPANGRRGSASRRRRIAPGPLLHQSDHRRPPARWRSRRALGA
jgi:hypothetical protein